MNAATSLYAKKKKVHICMKIMSPVKRHEFEIWMYKRQESQCQRIKNQNQVEHVTVDSD